MRKKSFVVLVKLSLPHWATVVCIIMQIRIEKLKNL